MRSIGGRWILAVAAALVAAPAGAQDRLTITAEGEWLYDSNLARSDRTRAAARGLVLEDVRFTPALGLDARLPFSRHAILLDGMAGYAIHRRNARLDGERLRARAGAELALGLCTAALAGLYERRRTDPEDLVLDEADNLQDSRAVAAKGDCRGVAGLWPAFTVEFRETDNSRPLRRLTDRDTFSATAQIVRAAPSFGEAALFAGLERTRFPNRAGPAGADSGFDFYQAGLRFQRHLGSVLRGSASLGYGHVVPQEAGLPGFAGAIYGLNLLLFPVGRLKGRVQAAREVLPSGRIGATYALDTQRLVEAEFAVTRRTTISAFQSWRRRTYRSGAADLATTNRADRITAFWAAMRLAVTDRLSLLLDARRERRNADQPGFDYVSRRVALSTRFAL